MPIFMHALLFCDCCCLGSAIRERRSSLMSAPTLVTCEHRRVAARRHCTQSSHGQCILVRRTLLSMTSYLLHYECSVHGRHRGRVSAVTRGCAFSSGVTGSNLRGPTIVCDRDCAVRARGWKASGCCGSVLCAPRAVREIGWPVSCAPCAVREAGRAAVYGRSVGQSVRCVLPE